MTNGLNLLAQLGDGADGIEQTWKRRNRAIARTKQGINDVKMCSRGIIRKMRGQSRSRKLLIY
jgi:hypothetical protein